MLLLNRAPWPQENPAVVGVLVDIRSLYNVGAIFRAADGAGVGGLVLCGITPVPPRNEIRKSALGAEESVPWRQEQEVGQALAWLRERGYTLIALEKNAQSTELYTLELPEKIALIVGNEYWGLPEEVLTTCDVVCHLPMRGRKISLNVSVAFGIAAYEVCRRLL